MTEKRTCSCAVCMGFEPWVTDFAGCMIERFIATGAAVAAGIAVFVPRED